MKENEVWLLVTHVTCGICSHEESFSGKSAELEDVDDFEDAVYEEVECCRSPFYQAVIESPTALFPPDDLDNDLNSDYYMPPGVASPFREASDTGKWRYILDDDFFETFEKQYG